jgi:peptidoglycan/LPS O-acetylase OafA/YrhL
VASAEHKIPSLDGLRAVSISLVIFAHCAGTPHSYSTKWLSYAGEIGVLGVKVFFVISGFLITTILRGERETTGAISLKSFYFRRTFRILPAFYAFLIVVLWLNLYGVFQIPTRDFVHAATFTANTTPMGWDLLHTWSLSVEEQFYLLWPISLVILGDKLPLRLAGASVVLCPLFFGVILHAHMRLGEAISGLAAGCVLAGIRETLHKQPRYGQFLAFNWVPATLAVCLLLLESLHRFGFYEELAPLISIVIALLVDSVINQPFTGLGRFLNLKPIAYIGVLSYSIYLWQEIFLNRWGHYWFNVFPINLLCALLCSVLSYYLIESPFLRLRNRLQRQTSLVSKQAPESQAQLI